MSQILLMSPTPTNFPTPQPAHLLSSLLAHLFSSRPAHLSSCIHTTIPPITARAVRFCPPIPTVPARPALTTHPPPCGRASSAPLIRRSTPVGPHVLAVCSELVGSHLPTEAAVLWSRLISFNLPGISPRAHNWFPLLLLQPAIFVTAVSLLRQERNLDPGSLSTELAHLIVPARLLQLQVPWLLHQVTLLKRERRALGPAWLPLDERQVVTVTQARVLYSNRMVCKYAFVAWLAFVQGRRVGDMFQLEKQYIFRDNAIGPAVIVRFHKTASTLGPFTMHLTEEVMLDLLHWVHQSPHPTWIFLALGESVRLAEARLKRRWLPTTDLRGLRRGGLCNASAAAENDADLLVMSDHTSLAGLRTYLGCGLLAQPRRQQQLRLTNHNVALTSRTVPPQRTDLHPQTRQVQQLGPLSLMISRLTLDAQRHPRAETPSIGLSVARTGQRRAVLVPPLRPNGALLSTQNSSPGPTGTR